MGVTHVPSGEGRSLWILGELVTYKTTSKQTGGAYSLFEVATQPGGGVPPHVQHREDESFWVLEVEYEFLIEGRTIRVGADSLLYVPKGTLHAHKNVGEGLGRMLVSQTPGGLCEHFFEEVGKKVVDGETGPLILEDQPNLERIMTIGVQYGIEIPPPIAQHSRG
jgi:mannose-6-phosphate isomerase-like protein (cupin superfamily)